MQHLESSGIPRLPATILPLPPRAASRECRAGPRVEQRRVRRQRRLTTSSWPSIAARRCRAAALPQEELGDVALAHVPAPPIAISKSPPPQSHVAFKGAGCSARSAFVPARSACALRTKSCTSAGAIGSGRFGICCVAGCGVGCCGAVCAGAPPAATPPTAARPPSAS